MTTHLPSIHIDSLFNCDTFKHPQIEDAIHQSALFEFHDDLVFHQKCSLSRRLIPAKAGIYLRYPSMKLTKDERVASSELKCRELKAKK